MTALPVKVDKVDKSFGRQRALANVSFAIAGGRATVLLGPNGAGKSTLLRILATSMRPTRGTVTYGARAADDEVRASIGVVAHESLCYGDLSARENLHFFGRLHGLGDVVERTDRLIDRVGLAHAADRPSRAYSRGMLQRLAVARALIPSPEVLLLDEPFTGLDRLGVEQLAEILDEEKRRGAAVLIVTHDLEVVAPLADFVVVINRGKVVYAGDPPADRQPAALSTLYREVTAA